MRFYITTAIDYVNGRPHLGTAYEKITADVLARYHRLRGATTWFVMGNDEHSQNVFRRARELGEDPLAYCDRMERVFRDVWAKLDISFDDFIRTTEPRHRAGVQMLVQRCLDAGDVYEGEYEGWYCVSCESFKQEKDLVDGACPVHLTVPDWIKEKNYFFRLSKYRDRLLEHFATHPDFLQPEARRNEIVRLLEAGLEDISISRAGQAWGIPLPFAPDNVVYVWFDALINYASAVGLGTDPDLLKTWWPADLHVVGKDITRFHAVVWPAMLLSAGLALPKQIVGHGWVTFKGERMSKSLGTAVDPLDAAEHLGPDPLRLYLVKEIPYGGDGDFTWERFEEKYNADLANNLGNLIGRLTTLATTSVDGRLYGTPTANPALAEAVARAVECYHAAMARLALHEAAGEAFGILGRVNEYLNATQPWRLARQLKGDGDADVARATRDQLVAILQDGIEATRIATVLLLPIMPTSGAAILHRLGEPQTTDGLRFDVATTWTTARDRVVTTGAAIWPRLESKPLAPAAGASKEPIVNEEQRPAVAAEPAPVVPAGHDAAAAPTTTAPAEPAGPRITIDDFMKVELRVAKVLAAERVPKSKKLLKLSVDLGVEQRTIVAGIAEAYEPDALVGRTIVVVANLQPAKLMGIESNGMVLAGSPDGGAPVLVGFDAPPPPGSRVR